MSRGAVTTLIVVASAWLSLWIAVPRASAHGKDVVINLDSWTGATDSPLTRLYRADVRYATDSEPVLGARLVFSAVRQEDGSGTTDSIAFSELSGSSGAYVAEVHYARFGTWEITLRTDFPGQGETALLENITPAGSGATDQKTLQPPQQARFVMHFDGRDVLNISIRTLHSIAGMTYVAMAGVLLLGTVFRRHMSESPLWASTVRAAMPVAFGVLVAITLTGVYTGYFDGPIRAPGAFDLTAMSQVPFGTVYMAALWAKVLLALAVLVFVNQARSVTSVSSRSAIMRLGVVYGTLVVILLASVAVLVYLHSLSHLSGYLAAR
ncbi:MAG: hypothetical protein NVSMB2_21730 [Chloroflexota bacterium]